MTTRPPQRPDPRGRREENGMAKPSRSNLRLQLNGQLRVLSWQDRHGLPHGAGRVRQDTATRTGWAHLRCAICGEWVAAGSVFLRFIEADNSAESILGYHVACWRQYPPSIDATADLLAVCEHLAAVLEHWDAPDAPSRDDLLAELHAAIAKAKGQS